jgi:choloylglycine hydrolase
VKKAVKDVVLVPTELKGLGAVAPAHFFIRDRNGKSIAVEPIGGKLKVYNAPLGVMTNSPGYDWHMTNLRNYINLTPDEVNEAKLGKVTLPTFGTGAGLVGLPGDFTPPSRFVRAAVFSANAAPTDNADDAVLAAFHILNQFDIPKGSVKTGPAGHVGDEITEWTAVSDLKNLRWYFRTREDQTIRMVDLKEAMQAADGEVTFVSMTSQQPIVNASTKFMAADTRQAAD